jgi:hypothetical protein
MSLRIYRTNLVSQFTFLALLSSTFILAGCQGETRVPVFPVSGTVSFKGETPVGAQIVLHAVNRSTASDVAPVGTVKADGSFAITAYEPGDGAPQGEYVATVEWFRLITKGEGAGARGPNVIPKEYASPMTSPIRVSVNSGPTQVPPIEIR